MSTKRKQRSIPEEKEILENYLISLRKSINEEIRADCFIQNGKLLVFERYLEREITSLEDVLKLNWDYAILKAKIESFDYVTYFNYLPVRQKFEKFEELAEDIYIFRGKEYYYSILADILTFMNFKWDWKNEILELIQIGSNWKHLMKAEEFADFNKLPDSFTVFRGVSLNDKQHDVEDYLSTCWTLDYETAKLHAKKHTGTPIIFKYEAQKRNVIAYFTRYGEDEILLDFNHIDFQEVEIEYLG